MTPVVPAAPHLSLEGFEGPLDLLLELARAQKVDLARISILRLVEQYLAVVERARSVKLELAADWLVMAAWLAWLKSRLLLPPENPPDTEAEDATELLHARLAELDRMRAAARWLGDQPRLGDDVHGRGIAEDLTEIDRSGLRVDVSSLIGAYLGIMRRRGRKRQYTPPRIRYWTVTDAAAALRRLLNTCEIVGWHSLTTLVPETEATPPARRAAMAGALVASLEMAKNGELKLHQQETFADIMLRRPDINPFVPEDA